MPKSIFRRISKKFFILTNMVVAWFFVLACYSNHFNPSTWWFLGLLTLSAFYIFLLLLLFMIFWLFVKPGYSLIFLITVAVTWNPLHKIIPLRSPAAFEVKKQTNALRVMSWNVAQFNILEYKTQPELKNGMIELINKNQPDIACFQEMVAGDTIVNLNTPYYHKYAFFALDDFSAKLNFPYHFYSYNVKSDFMNQQHFGIIIFSKYPIIHKKTMGYYPYDYNSIFQYADIVKDQDTFRVFNIHLQSLKFTKSNLQYIDNPSIESENDLRKSKTIISKLKFGFQRRQLQANRIREAINESPYPVIVCGDFNDVPNSYAYETIGKGLKNAFEEKGGGIDRTFSGISPTLRIDNIFANKQFKMLQYTRINKKLSDHFPVLSDMQFQKQ